MSDIIPPTKYIVPRLTPEEFKSNQRRRQFFYRRQKKINGYASRSYWFPARDRKAVTDFIKGLCREFEAEKKGSEDPQT